MLTVKYNSSMNWNRASKFRDRKFYSTDWFIVWCRYFCHFLQSEAGWEEYYDYIFPDDEGAKPNLKLLSMAKKWKEATSDSDESDDDEDAESADEDKDNDTEKDKNDDATTEKLGTS